MNSADISDSSRGVISHAKQKQLLDLSQLGPKKAVTGNKGLVVSSNPLVSQVAVDVLKDGGNAVDAIVAAAVAQTVVEPPQNSLAGVCGMLYFEASTGKVSYLNGGANFPLVSSTSRQDWNANGAVYLRDGRGVCVPGFWGGVEEALRVHGSFPKKRLLAPAIDFARNGFEVYPFLYGFLYLHMANLGISEQGREIYMPNGKLVKMGDRLYQNRAADLLERLVEEGNDYYYHGGFAEQICKAVQASNGWLAMADFEAYQARWDTPVQTTYRGYDFFAAPAPDYGGQVLAETFNMLEQFDLKAMGPAAQSPETLWRMKQIIRRVDNDNNDWNLSAKKPDLEQILSKEFAAQRVASLPEMGLPKPTDSRMGSNNITVTDAQGNVATFMHTSIISFSSGIYVDGIQIPSVGALASCGLPNGGERLKLRLATNMFLKDNKPVLVSGSPSQPCVEAVTQCSTSFLDFGMSLEETVHQPRFGGDLGVSIPEGFFIEADMPQKTFDFLQHKQVPFQKMSPRYLLNGCFEAIAFDEHGMAHACSDPRRVGKSLAL